MVRTQIEKVSLFYVDIGARLQNIRHALVGVVGVVVGEDDVVVRVAVRRDIPIEAPFLAGDLGQQPVVRAARDPVDRIVCQAQGGGSATG